MAKGIWRRVPVLAELQAMGEGTAVANLGIEFTEVGDDCLTARMPVDARTIQPAGLLHGGSSVLLAETLCSAAAYHCLDPEVSYPVGLEINANHLRGVRSGWVRCTVRPIHVGRSTQVWEARIVDDADRPVCVSRLTLAVVPNEAIARRA